MLCRISVVQSIICTRNLKPGALQDRYWRGYPWHNVGPLPKRSTGWCKTPKHSALTDRSIRSNAQAARHAPPSANAHDGPQIAAGQAARTPCRYCCMAAASVRSFLMTMSTALRLISSCAAERMLALTFASSTGCWPLSRGLRQRCRLQRLAKKVQHVQLRKPNLLIHALTAR